MSKLQAKEMIASLFKDVPEINQSSKIVAKQKIQLPDKPEEATLKDIVELNFKLEHKDIRMDKYKSDNLLDPQSQAEKDKYFLIYNEYVSNAETQITLAKKFGMSREHISRIIKYVTFQIGDPDPNAALVAMIDGLELRKKKIQEESEFAMEVGEKAACWKAMLQIDKLTSQLSGLLSSALIDMSDKRTVNVKMGEHFKRRSGSDMKTEDAVEVEAEVVDQEDDIDPPAQPNIDRRTGSEMGAEE